MLADALQNSGSGKLTAGIELDSSIQSVIEFIETYFAEFSTKMKGNTTSSEKSLTDKLCKFLNRKADSHPFFFHHENVENPDSGRSPQIDLGTVSRSEQLIVGDRTYGEDESFFSIEAKRLPTPGHKREKEYVIGHNKPCGGIERFKRGIHGNSLRYAAIIGYIQKHDAEHWFLQINNWITDLTRSNPSEWIEDDKLVSKNNIGAEPRKFVSKNIRTATNDHINLFHFWINLTDD